jgi:tRNA (cmo5U34)-methyltransferase
LGEWKSVEHALEYLSRADSIPHRTEGEAALIEQLPESVRRVLDLGTGDGRLLGLVKLSRPEATGVALDFSPTMLDKARGRFAGDGLVRVVEHDLNDSLPDLGTFDAVISCFAIHHCEDGRKRELYGEVFNALEPGGVFCNLEHVSSPTQRLHERFRDALGVAAPEEEDPSNRLLDVETQLRWLREIGFSDVDCHWKWLELALLGGVKPG